MWKTPPARDRPTPARAPAWWAAVLVGLAVPATASAHRPPTRAEFTAIVGAVDRSTHHFYCPLRGAVDVSTRDRRWAAAFAVSNCGSGSIERRFYLRRASRWEVVASTSSRGIGVGSGPPCGPRKVPADVVCGVRGRS